MDPIAMALPILRDAFGAVPVSTEVFPDRPDRLVVVTLVGGMTDGFVMDALLGITCWGRDDHDALTMATLAADALRDAAEEHPYIFSADLESVSRDEWTLNGQARYYAQVRLTINTDE